MNQNPRAAQVPGRPSLALAWGGGVVFVASLATFLFEYLVSYGSPAPAGPVGAAIAIDVALFSIFALHHSLLARPIVKRLVTALIPVWAERSLFTWVSSALLIWVCLTWHPVPGTLYTLSGFWRVVGYLVQCMGLLLTGAGARALDVLDLAGVRPVLSARNGARPRHVPLYERGVFRIVRHPLYLGWALFVFGTPDMTGTRAVFAGVSTMYLVLAIPLEERALIAVFGDDYRGFQQTTRFRLFPGIW